MDITNTLRPQLSPQKQRRSATMAFSSSDRRSNAWRRKRLPMNLLVPLMALGGLYWFSASFFLAKRSLPFSSKCDEARAILQDVLLLSKEEADMVLGKENENDQRNGCWLPRKVDSLVILVVDALRFDFARDHLPMSVGARLSEQNRTAQSQLLQFVADPPTVTMQRLKGLTTGSLPTFADISGNMVRTILY